MATSVAGLDRPSPSTGPWFRTSSAIPSRTPLGIFKKLRMSVGGAIAAPMTAYQYDWNILPIGQLLWLKELESYVEFPPMQDPASYNLSQVLEEVKNRVVAARANNRERT